MRTDKQALDCTTGSSRLPAQVGGCSAAAPPAPMWPESKHAAFQAALRKHGREWESVGADCGVDAAEAQAYFQSVKTELRREGQAAGSLSGSEPAPVVRLTAIQHSADLEAAVDAQQDPSTRTNYESVPPGSPAEAHGLLVAPAGTSIGAATPRGESTDRCSSGRHVHLALALHSAMAARWCLLPIAALSVSGSVGDPACNAPCI